MEDRTGHEEERLRPLRGRVLLLDDQPMTDEGGIVVDRSRGAYLDYVVLAADDGLDFGAGDKVVVSDPLVGRRVTVDGTACRLVEAKDVLAVLE